MAITKQKKSALVSDLTTALESSRMTVYAKYAGLSVQEVQELRRSAREAGVTIKVVKNRLVRVSLESLDTYKDVDTSTLTGQLLYAFGPTDEVAPAQVLNAFAKTHPTLEFAGGISGEGALLSPADVKSLAGLPSKNELIGQTIAQLLSPVHDVTNALSGNLHALLDGISDHTEAKATA